MDEDELTKSSSSIPHTRQADLAAFELIDNKLCGDWQGQPKCPEKESEVYEKYAAEYPDGPRTAQALYQAVYRMAVLTDMYAADGSDKKANEAHSHARELAEAQRQIRRSPISPPAPSPWFTNWMKASPFTAPTPSKPTSRSPPV